MRIRENKSIQRENNILRLSYKARYIYVYVREHQVLQLCHRQVYPFQFVRSFHFIPKRAREREREREKIALRIMCSSPWICYGFLLFRTFLYTRYYEHHIELQATVAAEVTTEAQLRVYCYDLTVTEERAS